MRYQLSKRLIWTNERRRDVQRGEVNERRQAYTRADRGKRESEYKTRKKRTGCGGKVRDIHSDRLKSNQSKGRHLALPHNASLCNPFGSGGTGGTALMPEAFRSVLASTRASTDSSSSSSSSCARRAAACFIAMPSLLRTGRNRERHGVSVEGMAKV